MVFPSMWLLPMATDYDWLGVAHCNGLGSNGALVAMETVAHGRRCRPFTCICKLGRSAWTGPSSFQMVCAGGSATVAPDRDRRGASSGLSQPLADGFNGVNGMYSVDCTLALLGSQVGVSA
jgi:hypothetical protein